MKLTYGLLLLAVIGVLVLSPAAQMKAQDTLTVQWADGFGNPVRNALRDAIKGDTLVGGARANANRVYLLLQGGYYWLEDRLENPGFALRLVGRPGDPTDSLKNPPMIQMVARLSDGSVDGRMLTGGGEVLLKNLYITGRDNNGVQTYYQPIQIDVSNSTIVVDNCVLEHTNFAPIAFTGKNNKIIYRNNKLRNLVGKPSTQQWEGRGVSIWADQDSVIFENNTFFNNGMTAFQLEGGSAKVVIFNHNTLVNIGRSVNTGNWWQEAYFTNNLLINVWWHGEGASDLSNTSRDPRADQSGIFSISGLPSVYGPEEGRRILWANSAAYIDPKFITFYADTIHRQWYANRVTKEDFLDRFSLNQKYLDTTWLGAVPTGFGTYPAELIDSMIQNINDLRRGVTPARQYLYRDPVEPLYPAWPIPEDFSYTQANLKTAGTDGLPLGDLNWFPTAKATYLATRDAEIKKIHDLAGPVVVFTVDTSAEAEAGTLANGSRLYNFSGFSYYQMDGGGWIQWDFDLATAGQYDLNVWTHMRGNAQRGQHTFVNATEIHDAAHGWGELIYDNGSGVTNGMPIDAWTWVKWTQADLKEAGALTMPAGHNTIRITPSWGYQNFAGIDLYPAGTTTVAKSLRAPDATYAIVAPHGEGGGPFTPSHFKSVVMGPGSTINWTLPTKFTAKYVLGLFYSNPKADQTFSLKMDGTTVVNSMTATKKTDTTGTSILTADFNVTAGSHTWTLTATGTDSVNVDFIQLIKKELSSAAPISELPNGYALEQNYPNPFNPTTKINFSIAKASNVRLVVYNLLGQKVATLVDGQLAAGQHFAQFDAKNFASGAYFCRLEAGAFTSTIKMLLMK